jgi:hydrogenase maturation protease
MPSRTCVLGLGNLLLQDEGLGVRALERLTAHYRLPSEVEAMDGGTMGLDLLPYLDQDMQLLILDAVEADQPPGTLVRLEGEAIQAALSLKMSMHQVGLQELLALSDLQGTLPQRVVVWGMEPAWLDWGTELSPQVGAQLENLVSCVVRELSDWGVKVDRVSTSYGCVHLDNGCIL